jgi:hypothetical protein
LGLFHLRSVVKPVLLRRMGPAAQANRRPGWVLITIVPASRS